MNIFFSVVILIASLVCNAQLPDGSQAPDFTSADINGNTWHLYNELSSGKVVVLNFFGAWDSFAWDYYQTGELQLFNELYGDNGTGQVLVLNVESEPMNTIDQLSGPELITNNLSTQSMGDWITDNNIPIIDDSAIADSFHLNYLPTLIMICPDGVLVELSQSDAGSLYAELSGQACPTITEGLDPAITNVVVDNVCGNDVADISFLLKNLGSETLTNIYYVVNGIASPFGDTWTGSLASYQQETIVLEDIIIGNNSNVQIGITSADVNTSNNYASAQAGVASASLVVQLELNLDNWPAEVSWEIRNDNDEVVYSDGDFSVAYEYFNNTYDLPADGCYSFFIYDSNGDGLHGSQWGGFDGSCYLRSLNGDGQVISTIYSYDGSYNFSNVLSVPSFQKADFEASEALGLEENQLEGISFYPNPSDDQFTILSQVTDFGNSSVVVYDQAGRLITDYPAGYFNGGQKSIFLNTLNFAEGIYYVKITNGNQVTSLPMVVLHR